MSPLQLWEQLKSDADASFSGASALIKRSQDAQQTAAAFQEKLDSAKMYGAHWSHNTLLFALHNYYL